MVARLLLGVRLASEFNSAEPRPEPPERKGARTHYCRDFNAKEL